jgi:hypothetical protein
MTPRSLRALRTRTGRNASIAGLLLVGLVGTSLVACSKNETANKPNDGAPSASAAANESTTSAGKPSTGSAAGTAGSAKSASAGSAAPTGATAAAPHATGDAASYAVKYTLAPSTMYVPDNKEYSGVKFKNDESKFVGDGTMTLVIDPAGRVSGTSEGGPLGAAVVEGTVQGDLVTANIRRKDALDEGLTGTLIAKKDGDKLEGTMKLSEFNAAVVREAKITAQKAGK